LTIPLKDTSWTWSTLQGCLGGHVGLLGAARDWPKGAWCMGLGLLEAGVAGSLVAGIFHGILVL